MKNLWNRFIDTDLRPAVVGTFLACLVVIGITSEPACSPAANRVVKNVVIDVIDVLLAKCIAEHQDIQDEPALREVCKYSDEFAPVVKDLLAAQKRGAAKAAPKCGGGDGGR